MSDTSVRPFKGLEITNIKSEPDKELPEEFAKLLLQSNNEKVTGFINGGSSFKVIRDEKYPSAKVYTQYLTESYTNVIDKLKGENDMDTGSSMDTLFNELKTDMREREARSRQEIADREARFERQLERFAKDAQDREERIRQEAKEREERVERLITGVSTKVDDHASYFETLKNQNFWGNMAMFAGLLAILVALIIALK